MRNRFTGMAGFSILWMSQLALHLCLGMVQFAITMWVWEQTGSARALGMLGFFVGFDLLFFLVPISGALVDRFDRKRLMMIAHAAPILSSLWTLLLLQTGHLQIWHLCIAGALAGTFRSAKSMAYSVSITTMLPARHFMRANAMLGLDGSASSILGAVIGGFLLYRIGLSGLLLIHIVAAALGVVALLLVAIPRPAPSTEGAKARGTIWKEVLFGFQYVCRREYLTLLLVAFVSTVLIYVQARFMPSLILASTFSDRTVLGTVQFLAGVGGIAGALVVAVWGGPQRKSIAILVSLLGMSLLGIGLMGVGNGVRMWSTGAFTAMGFTALLASSMAAIWQIKVPPDIQGRVFFVRRAVAALGAGAGTLIANQSPDQLLQSLMESKHVLAQLLSRIVGTGPGAGLSVLFILIGVLGVLLTLGIFRFTGIRNIESSLPDYKDMGGRKQSNQALN